RWPPRGQVAPLARPEGHQINHRQVTGRLPFTCERLRSPFTCERSDRGEPRRTAVRRRSRWRTVSVRTSDVLRRRVRWDFFAASNRAYSSQPFSDFSFGGASFFRPAPARRQSCRRGISRAVCPAFGRISSKV